MSSSRPQRRAIKLHSAQELFENGAKAARRARRSDFAGARTSAHGAESPLFHVKQ